MPEYLSPGVYVEEVQTGPRPIEGVGTSTAGFAGFTERGPLEPRLVTSWQDYVRWYGSYVDDLGLGSGDIYLPYAVRGFFDNGGQRLYVARVVGSDATVASADLSGGGKLTATGPGAWGNNLRYQVVKATKAPAGKAYFRLLVLYRRGGFATDDQIFQHDPALKLTAEQKTKLASPDIVESFDNLSGDPADTNFAGTVVNAQSRLVKLDLPANTVPTLQDPADMSLKKLEGGIHANPGTAQYLDADENEILQRKGLAGLAAIDEIAILSAPGQFSGGTADVSSEVIEQCELLKDRFAIVSTAREVEGQSVTTFKDSTYGALYYPWVRVRAPHTEDGHILVPPAGHVAGVYARTDVERGVHKAPANEVVRGIIVEDLPGNAKPLSNTVDKGLHDILNPRGVNVIRDFRADRRGIRVWGARTMSSDAMWKYINVRRLFIFIEESIDQGTQWVVFEPNYELTWQNVRLSVAAFLRSVWKSGALAGTTADEAFFVKCDRTTMTQDDIDNGRLICLVGVAPVKPAEFVIFRVSQKTIEVAEA